MLAVCPRLVGVLILLLLVLTVLLWSFLLVVYSKVLPLVLADLLVHGSLGRLVRVWWLWKAVDSRLLLLCLAFRLLAALVPLLLVLLRRRRLLLLWLLLLLRPVETVRLRLSAAPIRQMMQLRIWWLKSGVCLDSSGLVE